jgi:hypothetical protein
LGSGIGGHGPQLVVLVEDEVLDGHAEAEPVQHAGLAGGALEVGVDLRLRAERARPVRVRREAERVELARHVAGGARVGVVAPGAADGRALVDDQEVTQAVLVELDRGAEPGEAGTDDEDADALGKAQGGVGGRGHAANPRGY